MPCIHPLFRALVYIALVGLIAPSWAQSKTKHSKKVTQLYREADKYRVTGRYSRAIATLEEVVKKDKRFLEAYFLLGVLYKQEREAQKSTATLQKGLELAAQNNPSKQRDFLFELGENALKVGEYQQAEGYLNRYLMAETQPGSRVDLAKRWLKNASFALKNKRSFPLNQPRFMDSVINQFRLQYFPVLTADEQEIIYTRRLSDLITADEDLMISRKNEQGMWLPPVSLSPQINSVANEGTCTISADGRILIFTSCVGREGFGSCDLFITHKEGENWTKPTNMGERINTDAWESQPSLSADGRTLYFTSDRHNGRGGKDIYVSYREKDGHWTEAGNLGQAINTPYDEISPFIHTNGTTLFFASNGRPGFGGYDIYKSDRLDNTWGEVENFGSLVNDFEDQFSLFISASGKKAYYSYEQTARLNSSKLVEVDIPEELWIKNHSYVVKGIVRDKRTKMPLKARIELFDLKKGDFVSEVESLMGSGRYLIPLTAGSEYALYTSCEGYLFSSLNFDFETSSSQALTQVVDIYLEKIAVGSSTQLSNLFFKPNEYELDQKSKLELDKLVKYLKDMPSLSLEVGGHTDSRGDEQYNQELSLKRAQAVVNYLTSQGIVQRRIIAQGYGDRVPMASNQTEEGRQKNRRIEFKITAL